MLDTKKDFKETVKELKEYFDSIDTENAEDMDLSYLED